MSERFTKLFSLGKNLYTNGLPVIISAGALLKDNVTGSIIAQLKLKRISSARIAVVKVRIVALDAAERPIGSPVEYQYNDLLAVRRDAEFGQKNAIVLPYKDARSFKVAINEVIFSDHSLYSDPEAEYQTIPMQKALSDKGFNYELIEQFKIRYGNACAFCAMQSGDLWFCVCGSVNHDGEEACHACKNLRSDVFNVDIEQLKADCSYRLNDAKYFEAIKEMESLVGLRKASQLFVSIPGHRDADTLLQQCLDKEADIREKVNKLIIAAKRIGVSAACVVILLILLIPRIKYASASKALAAGNYTKAIETFTELEDFKDSPEMLTAAKYGYADQLLAEGHYSNAYMRFLWLKDYESSAQKAVESGYGYAKQLIDANDYTTAVSILSRNSDYQDSKELLNYCYNCIGDEYYRSGNYKRAVEAFTRLAEKPDNYYFALYEYGKQLIEEGNGSQAVKPLTHAMVKIPEAAELLIEAKYVFVKDNYDRKNSTTYEYMKELKEAEYKDSEELFKKLYKWNVKVVWNSSEDDDVTSKASLNGYKPVYFHYIVEGGEPGEVMNLSYKIRMTDGNTWPYTIEDVSDGDMFYEGWSDGYLCPS